MAEVNLDAWRGRRADGGGTRIEPVETPVDDTSLGISWADLISLLLYTAALILVTTGAALTWGVGPALIGCGLFLAVPAILLGLGGDR